MHNGILYLFLEPDSSLVYRRGSCMLERELSSRKAHSFVARTINMGVEEKFSFSASDHTRRHTCSSA